MGLKDGFFNLRFTWFNDGLCWLNDGLWRWMLYAWNDEPRHPNHLRPSPRPASLRTLHRPPHEANLEALDIKKNSASSCPAIFS